MRTMTPARLAACRATNQGKIARTLATVRAAYEAQPGVWLGSSTLGQITGLSPITARKRALDLLAAGVIEREAGGHRFRIPPLPGQPVPVPAPQRRTQRAGAADDDRRPGTDQYDGRSAEDLLLMCQERGLDVDDDTAASELKRALREHTASVDTPGPYDGSGRTRATPGKRAKLTDEERRRQLLERQILEACADAPMRPRGVALGLLRNAAEVRAIMLDLAHRGLLVSRDGYSTFTAA